MAALTSGPGCAAHLGYFDLTTLVHVRKCAFRPSLGYMARASKTGVRGLFFDSTKEIYRIDLRWTDPHTGERKRHQEKLPKGTKAAAAKERARALLNTALAGKLVEEKKPEVHTLRAAFDRWLDYSRTHGIRTTNDRAIHARALVASLGDIDLNKITPGAIEAFKASGGRSPATINRHVSTLKTFATWARRHAGMSAEIEAAIRDVKMIREDNTRVRVLQPEELTIVTQKLTGWLRPIALTLLYTGARLGEVTSLRWKNVHPGALALTHTKTGHDRHVPIVDEIAPLFATPGRPDEYVFEVPARGPRLARTPVRSEDRRRRDEASKAWRNFAQAQGLDDMRMHDLRHDAATRLLGASGNLPLVASMLGHSDVRTTMRYAHTNTTQLAVAMRAAFSRPTTSLEKSKPAKTAEK